MRSSWLRSPLVLTLLTALAGVASWCAADAIHVLRPEYQALIRACKGPALMLLPAGAFVSHLVLLRGRARSRVLVAFATVFLSCFIAGLLVLTFGRDFHVAIGGEWFPGGSSSSYWSRAPESLDRELLLIGLPGDRLRHPAATPARSSLVTAGVR